MEIKSTKDIAAQRVCGLVYGSTGIGKTTLCKTLERPPLILSAEAGLLCLAGTEIDVIEISSWKGMREAFDYCLTKEACDKYDTIVLDSITEMSQRLLEELNQEYRDNKDNFLKWADYFSRMSRSLKSFRDIKAYNVFLIAQEKSEQDQFKNISYGPDLDGKIATRCPYFFDLVLSYRKFRDNEGVYHRAIYTQSEDGFLAKDRSGKLNRVEKPDLQSIINKILGEKE